MMDIRWGSAFMGDLLLQGNVSLCEEDKLGWSMCDVCVCVCGGGGGDWMNTEKRERKLRVDHLYTAVYHIALNFRGSKLIL